MSSNLPDGAIGAHAAETDMPSQPQAGDRPRLLWHGRVDALCCDGEETFADVFGGYAPGEGTTPGVAYQLCEPGDRMREYEDMSLDAYVAAQLAEHLKLASTALLAAREYIDVCALPAWSMERGRGLAWDAYTKAMKALPPPVSRFRHEHSGWHARLPTIDDQRVAAEAPLRRARSRHESATGRLRLPEPATDPTRTHLPSQAQGSESTLLREWYPDRRRRTPRRGECGSAEEPAIPPAGWRRDTS